MVGWDPDDDARAAGDDAVLTTVADLEGTAGLPKRPRVLLMWAPHAEVVDSNLVVLIRCRGVVTSWLTAATPSGATRADASTPSPTRACTSWAPVPAAASPTPPAGPAPPSWPGPKEGFDIVLPLLRNMAVDDANVFCAEPSPSGDFVKLVRNAIELSMVQAISGGVQMLRSLEHDLDLHSLLEHWNQGSHICSWRAELMGTRWPTAASGPCRTSGPTPLRARSLPDRARSTRHRLSCGPARRSAPRPAIGRARPAAPHVQRVGPRLRRAHPARSAGRCRTCRG